MSDQLTQKVHLLVLIHGMWGDTSHVASMHRIMEETQIFQEIEKLEKGGKKVTRFSVTGYSLGGLLARYVVGVLHQRQFFATVTPVNFNTMATPHIGLLKYPSFRSKLSSIFVPRFFSRTGEQFYGVDRWSNTGKSLLEVMADPIFPHIRIYANAINDVTVPYLTAYVDLETPSSIILRMILPYRFLGFNCFDREYVDKYYPIIKSFTIRTLHHQNVVVPATTVLVPILVPVVLTFVLIRISISSYHSRSRIRLLESEDPSATQRLVHVFGQLERQVEDIVVDMIDESANPAPIPSPNGDQVSKRRMVAALNALPQLKKERAFITDVANTHGTIIARDVKNFEFHKIGEGVLRHWADAFILTPKLHLIMTLTANWYSKLPIRQ
ncbi:putative serine esterase-domain-containing protein [Lactarius quietus]|nr:putative serine esterase-domain-containing protein [Lactarius quietus]